MYARNRFSHKVANVINCILDVFSFYDFLKKYPHQTFQYQEECQLLFLSNTELSPLFLGFKMLKDWRNEQQKLYERPRDMGL